MNHRRQPDRLGQIVEWLVERFGPPPRNDGPLEWMPEAVVVDLAICVVLIIFAMAGWDGIAALLVGGLVLRWRRRRSA